ncbi:hypothetical protein [Nostoc sp. CENA543]|nr:hypothetical protein [Nostoc sp. CENA543]
MSFKIKILQNADTILVRSLHFQKIAVAKAEDQQSYLSDHNADS